MNLFVNRHIPDHTDTMYQEQTNLAKTSVNGIRQFKSKLQSTGFDALQQHEYACQLADFPIIQLW
ncbi:MAG: hypothetical protein HC819_01585 [Cyclobacteriaceae bacterium]|nr:hypothetical protein [Cyclobacteriaceae bacterium]